MGATTLTAVLLDGERVKTSLWTYVAKPIIPTSLRLKTARS
jgi:hypothetical protein